MDPNTQQPQQPVNPQTVQPQVPQSVQKTSPLPKILLTIFGGVVVLGLIGGAYYLGTKTSEQQITKTLSQPSISPTSVPITSTTASTNQNERWLTYTNKTYQYSFTYPSSWILNSSDAEPKTTASNLMTSASFVSLTTPEGYQLKFSYNLYGVGGSGISFYKFKNVTIDRKPFTKAYLNNCYGPGGPQANVTPVPSTCQNVFSEITYVPNANFTDKLAGTLFDMNGKVASLTFSLGNTQSIALDDPTFQKMDNTLDQVINSFKFPTQ